MNRRIIACETLSSCGVANAELYVPAANGAGVGGRVVVSVGDGIQVVEQLARPLRLRGRRAW
jgi:hypothetical protein